jgi:hypothetical protein
MELKPKESGWNEVDKNKLVIDVIIFVCLGIVNSLFKIDLRKTKIIFSKN